MSFGMQSVVPRFFERSTALTILSGSWSWLGQRCRFAGELAYGTPNETLDDWERSLDSALACTPDHISAYALIVEPGTKLERQIRSGALGEPDEDLVAGMYERADARFAEAGYEWYEVSNWARYSETHRSRHNLAYWQGHDWWGIGPGAHSHIGGTRWWNVKHPTAYADRILAGHSPAAGRETLDAKTREIERVLLLTRIRGGLTMVSLSPSAHKEIPALIAEELINAQAALEGSVELTLQGRLLADLVVRRLT
jgi:oxygen-independent coproporphyrinogen-3 oxidase